MREGENGRRVEEMIAAFLRDDSAQSGTEYVLLLALVTLGVIAAAYGIGDDVRAILERLRLALSPVQNALTPIYQSEPSLLGGS
jgi:Flp pilus assembly pilin Flp